MSTVKNEILSNIVKLSSDELNKVELARIGVDEIRKSYDSVLAARNESTAALRKATEAAIAIENSAKSLSVRANEFLKNYEVFSNDVKTLGLEVPANLSNLDKVVKEDLKTSQQLFKNANTIKSFK